MDAIIDNVLLTYVSYGLVLTSGKPEVLRAASATFSEKEVAGAKDVLWTQCLDHLGEKNNRNPSSLRSRKMANVLDILDAVDELRNKCKMPCCVTDAIGIARLFNRNRECFLFLMHCGVVQIRLKLKCTESI